MKKVNSWRKLEDLVRKGKKERRRARRLKALLICLAVSLAGALLFVGLKYNLFQKLINKKPKEVSVPQEIAKETPKPVPKCADCKELLYLNFDDNFINQINQGAGENFGAGFKEGNWGQGIYFEEKSYLRFPAAKNINYRKGTIELWFKPESFFPEERELIYANGVDGWSEDDVARMGVLDKTFWVEINGPAGGAPQIFQDISAWDANVFHYIVMTWDTNYVKLYLDGNLAAEKKLNRHPSLLRNYIFIGNMNINGTDFVRPAKGIIDELRIYDGVKGEGDVRESYGR